jgi:hypothetical protein
MAEEARAAEVVAVARVPLDGTGGADSGPVSSAVTEPTVVLAQPAVAVVTAERADAAPMALVALVASAGPVAPVVTVAMALMPATA